MRYGFGVDIGGTTVKLAYFHEDGVLLDKWEIPTVTADNGKQILPDVAASIAGYLQTHGIQRESILGIGVGVPGPVDGRGVVNRCVNLGWGVFNIAQELARLTGFPVKAGNDANVAALGEYWMGGGAGCSSMVMVTLGTGVGGGIVLEGKLLHGAHGSGGEIGHIVLRRGEQEACGCGKFGCVEQYCSATGVVRLARRHLQATETESCLRKQAVITAKDVFDAGKAGDTVALEILEDYYDHLGEFLADLCCVVDPEVVVLGGGVCKAGRMLIDGMKPYFLKHVFHAAAGARFEIARLGNDAGVYGTFKLVLDAFG